jgi:hypothetical protein
VSLPVNTGFTTNDITQSEISFKTIPLPFAEPVGDLATGQSGSFTDLVTSPTDKSGLMAFYDGTNLIFRLRVGGISAGAKGYSILIDADNKAGNSGSQPDPNYVAPTAQGTGNIGFEWEVLLATGNSTTVTVYETDGKTGPNIVQAYQVTNGNNWQIAQALTTNSNNPDYFYDFYVPLSAFTGTYAITGSTSFRMAATTVNSPTSALTGSRSDIFGVNDVNYPSTPDGWLAALNGTPPVTLTNLSSGSIGGICTNPPVITSSSVTIGSGASISGTWTRRDNTMDANATITIYRYSSAGTLLNAYTSTSAYPGGVATGATWTITGITAAAGDYFVAKAKGTSTSLNESECMQSNSIYAACGSALDPTVLTQSSLRGICGSLTAGATAASIYKMDATGVTLMNANSINTTYTSNSFTWWSCVSGNNVANGTYMIILTGSGCQSTPVFDCISNGSSTLTGLSTNTGITFPSAVYPYMSSISGSIPSSASTQSASIFVNGMLKSTISIAANATTYTFSGLQLKSGDNIKVYVSPASGCTTYNSTTVVCYNQPPLITTDANGKLMAGATTISGTSTANAGITLNKTGVTTNSWTTTANSSGAWSATVPALVAGDTYTAMVTSANSCNTASAASATATVVSVTTACTAVTSTLPFSDTSTVVKGTVDVTATGSVVRAYLDGTLIGSQTMNTVAAAQGWQIISSQPFYNGAVVKVTFQSGTNGSENTGCTTYTVICTSPVSPSITPTTSTIDMGQAVTYTVSNLAGTTWYAVQDNSGTSYATSTYTSASPSSNISISTSSFNTAGTYNLKITADKLTGCAASYATALVTVSNIPLPVKFIGMWAKNADNGVQVNWQVTNEVNVKEYVVERSYDGRIYANAGTVDYHRPQTSINHYTFTDVSANNNSKIYYRIRQVDIDGRFTFSSIAIVTPGIASSMQVFPNPAVNEVNINITVANKQLTTVDLIDLNGRKLLSKTVYLVTGGNSFSLDHLSRLPKGSYFIRIFADAENCYHKVIIK